MFKANKNSFGDMRSDSAAGDRLKGDLARVVVEANFELVEHSTALKLGNIKSLAVGASTVIRL
jgi:hypothetical protein